MNEYLSTQDPSWNGVVPCSRSYQKKPRMIRGFSVPGVGIEPTLLAEREFESRASTNSATRASLTGGGQK